MTAAKKTTVTTTADIASSLKVTPRDMIVALRLVKVSNLLEPGDDEEIKTGWQNLAAGYLSLKRAGKTDLEFTAWLDEDADEVMAELMEGEQGSDPTA